MDFEEFHKRLADAPLGFRRKMREYLRHPTERNACYTMGYVAALEDAHLFKADDAASYWLALIGRTEGNGALGCDLIAEMDNPPAGPAHQWGGRVSPPGVRPHPAITHCDNCGCDWLDNGLNPVGCPYCELRREVERRWEGNRRAAQEYVEDMRDVLQEAAQICKDLDEEALAKESRLACGTECAAAIADLAARMKVPFKRRKPQKD